MAKAIADVQPRDDFTIDQNWDEYTDTEHGVWRHLFQRQADCLNGRATPEFLAGLSDLEIAADGIPDFRRLNDMLGKVTGWQIVAVPGLVPDGIFFDHLANRRFPSTCFIRKPQEMDYLEEPDVFHDVFGHVPLLVNPVFADYMQAYGRGGVKALELNALSYLTRLYWYTVEFGLINRPEGMRIYGAGIVSSRGESVFSLEDPAPNRLGFDLERIMRTLYRIDDYQETYFVIDNFEQLFEATAPDFTPLYDQLRGMNDLEPGAVVDDDNVIHRGQGRT
jgi:phenylalanine-4-hydroxylase